MFRCPREWKFFLDNAFAESFSGGKHFEGRSLHPAGSYPGGCGRSSNRIRRNRVIDE